MVTDSQIKLLDPTGVRTRLFAKTNSEAAKVGDILLVRLKNGEPFSGVCMNIRRRGVDTGILLRNQLTRVGVEMWYKIYSPNVTGIEVVQRREKKARRARLYYLRYVWHGKGVERHRTNNIAGSRSTIWVLSKVWFDNIYDSALSWVRRSPNATSTITRRRRMARREDERQSSIIGRLASTCIKCITAWDEEVVNRGVDTIAKSCLHGSSTARSKAQLPSDALSAYYGSPTILFSPTSIAWFHMFVRPIPPGLLNHEGCSEPNARYPCAC